MKKILILALAVVMGASVAYGQPGGFIDIYSDVGYTDCNLTPTEGAAVYYAYIVHDMAPTAKSSQFKLGEYITGSTLVPLAATFYPNLYIGDIYTGVTVWYLCGSVPCCETLPWLVGTVPYFYMGTPGTDPTCTYYLQIEPHPAAETGHVEAVDCADVKQIAGGGHMTFFGDISCSCTVGTEATSWSKVKSLYR